MATIQEKLAESLCEVYWEGDVTIESRFSVSKNLISPLIINNIHILNEARRRYGKTLPAHHGTR